MEVMCGSERCSGVTCYDRFSHQERQLIGRRHHSHTSIGESDMSNG